MPHTELKAEEIEFIKKMEEDAMPDPGDWLPLPEDKLAKLQAFNPCPDRPEGFKALSEINESSDDAKQGDLLEIHGVQTKAIFVKQLPSCAVLLMDSGVVSVNDGLLVRVANRV